MRVEIRKSDSPGCETCGATELVQTKLGKPLVFDAAHLFAAERKQLEADLRRAYEDKLSLLVEQAGLRANAARTAVQELEAHHFEVRAVAAAGVDALVGGEYARIRFRARRRQRKLIEGAAPIIESLLASTARV